MEMVFNPPVFTDFNSGFPQRKPAESFLRQNVLSVVGRKIPHQFFYGKMGAGADAWTAASGRYLLFRHKSRQPVSRYRGPGSSEGGGTFCRTADDGLYHGTDQTHVRPGSPDLSGGNGRLNHSHCNHPAASLFACSFGFQPDGGLHIRQIETLEQQQREEYDRRRNLLLSDVAHDLKTPMTTVAGYARALLEEQDAPVREYLEAIYGKSMQMSGLISLLFEYVKLDSEGYQLKKSQENLWELLRECVASLYLDFEEKDMEISADIPEEPLWFPADKLQFQRVISNLLNNAIRHNPRGTRVFVKAAAEEETILIRISDSGAEISEEVAEYIFDPFVSGDESRRSKGGSGLGLCIAHKIIAMHQGSLTLEQNHSQGETKSFVIRLPAAEETLR